MASKLRRQINGAPPIMHGTSPSAAYGINLGYGFSKSFMLVSGESPRHIIFPSLISEASAVASGSVQDVRTVVYGNRSFWVGEDALLASSAPMTAIGSSRLDDPLFYPVLLRATLDALNAWEYPGVCVTGLPATMISRQYAERLGDHFRAATADRPVFVEPEGIYVIPEPVCLLYAWLLDDTGAERMPGALRGARYAYLDIGHYTVDGGTIENGVVTKEKLFSRPMGTYRWLSEIRSMLIAAFHRDFTLFETDEAVRRGAVEVRGKWLPLPDGWDAPIHRHAVALRSLCEEQWQDGGQFRSIIVGGGGAEQQRLIEPLLHRYDHIDVVDDPQFAIARGAARRARQILTVRLLHAPHP